MNILNTIGAGIVAIGLFIGGLFGYSPEPQVVYEPAPTEESLGVALPAATAVFETSLAAGITADATTLTLTSVSIRGGGILSGYVCLSLDEGSAQAEFVCGTASSTSVTGLERGLSPADGITEDTDLQFSHRRGASVKITDFPLIQRIKSQNDGTGTYESVLSYASGVTPVGGSELVDVEYVTSAITGTSTLSYNKIIVNGTAGETLATGNILYLKASDSRWYKADNDISSTYVDQTLGIAQGAGATAGAISGGVLTYGLDSTQKSMTGGTFIFLSATAGATSTATTSQILGKAISATTMFFDQNLIDSSVYVPKTFLATTTLGTTTIRGYEPVEIVHGFYIASTTGTSTFSVPTGIKKIKVQVVGGGGGGGSGTDEAGGGGGGGGGGYAREYLDVSSTSTIIYYVGNASEETRFGGGSGVFLRATAGSSGLQASPGGVGGAGGVGSGGDINIGGQSGGTGGGTAAARGAGGNGGSSVLGGGGTGAVSTNNGAAGGSGQNYGGGGGGGSETGGASGAQGVIIIEW